MQIERRGLEAHLSECNFRRECPKGCGHTLLSSDQSQHNCVAELRSEVEMLRCVCAFFHSLRNATSDHMTVISRSSLKTYGRAEMLCKVEEVRREMESRLDSQRRHMVQKESHLKNEVEELKVTCHIQNNNSKGIRTY